MKEIFITTIRFPDIHLQMRDAHKLRGYFGQMFKKYSELLHNHYETGELRYRYPLVQYKVPDQIPTLVALEEGAELLTKLFLQIKELNLEGSRYYIHSKNIENQKVHIGYCQKLHEYRFQTIWLALNQDNYHSYKKKDLKNKYLILEKIMVGNVLSFFKNMDLILNTDQRLMVKIDTKENITQFKNQKMIGFEGSFIINAELPDNIGLGKAVSRGYGTIKKIN